MVKNIEIVDYSHQGFGIGKKDKKIYFVENTLIGENVDVKVINNKKNIYYCIVVKFNTLSKNRITPKCIHYGECGGCQIMHMNYDEQLQFKKKIVQNVIKKKQIVKDLEFQDVIANKESFEYRNKVTFSFEEKSGKIYVALKKSKSHDDVIIDRCWLINNKMHEFKERLLDYINANFSNKLEIFKKLMIRQNDSNQYIVLIDVQTKENITNKFNNFLRDNQSIVKFVIRNNKKVSTVLDEDFSYTLGSKEFYVNVNSFFQINTRQTKVMYDVIKGLIKRDSKEFVDLYCGVGSIGIYCANKNSKLLGIEVVKDAVVLAQKNAKINNIKRSTFLELNLDNNTDYDLSCDVLIVDPSRKGLSKKLVSKIKDNNIQEIIYMSCSFNSLVRDLEMLSDKYIISFLKGYDMFSQTYHLELICKLELK